MNRTVELLAGLAPARRAAGALAALALIALAPGAGAAVTVLAGGSTVAGKTIGQWQANYWNWAESFAPGPISDTTGARAATNQSGPVYFLGTAPYAVAGGGTPVARSFSIPADKYVLIPVFSFLIANGADAPFASTKAEANAVTAGALNPANLVATLDGVAVSLATHREETGSNFTLVAAAGNDMGTPAGSHADAYSDGYWLMLAPMTPGVHTLTFGGTSSAYSNGGFFLPGLSIGPITDTVTVTAVPEPGGATAAAVAAMAAAAAGRRRRRRAPRARGRV